ncbi:MAG: tetratricopeptide repeat protein [Candidatus Eremiobacteraeota bacterium]|nr:tetratricopeptide repeat protein [Candidatus Eremiobacteraeota bacterium]
MKSYLTQGLFERGFALVREGKLPEAYAFFLEEKGSPSTGGSLLFFLGRIKSLGGEGEAARQYFLQALQREKPLLRGGEIFPLLELALIAIKGGAYEEARRLFDEAAAVIQGPHQAEGRALFHHYRGIFHYRLREKAKALDDFRASLEISLDLGLLEEASRVYDSRGQLYFDMGDLAEAVSNFEESMALKEKAGDRLGLAITWGNLGRAHLMMADHQKAFEYFARDLEFCRKQKDAFGQMVMCNNMGRTYLHSGDAGSAGDLVRESLKIAEMLGNRVWVMINRKDLAHGMVLLGEEEGVERTLDEVEKSALELGNERLLAEAHGIRGLFHWRRREWEEADKCYEKALSLLQKLDMPFDLIGMEMQAGTMLLERGDKLRALEILEKALDKAELLRAPWMIARFEELIRQVAEHEWIRVKLRRYVGRQVMDDILTGAEKSALGGTRQKVTVLVSDIRGYTEFSQEREPEEIVAMLNDYFALMVEVIHRSRGTIDKFIGDAILAYFGAPVTYGNDSERALEAAIGMMEALKKYNRIRAKKNEAPIAMGIGIYTGDAIVGNIGSYQRKDYTVVGKTVSRAFQLCSEALPGQILIGESTCRENEGALLKGRVHPLGADSSDVFEVLW